MLYKKVWNYRPANMQHAKHVANSHYNILLRVEPFILEIWPAKFQCFYRYALNLAYSTCDVCQLTEWQEYFWVLKSWLMNSFIRRILNQNFCSSAARQTLEEISRLEVSKFLQVCMPRYDVSPKWKMKVKLQPSEFHA